MKMYDLQRYLDKNVEDIVVFLNQRMSNSYTSSIAFYRKRNAQITFAENPKIKINSLKKQKHEYLINA